MIKENVAKRYGPSIVIRASKKWLRITYCHRGSRTLRARYELITDDSQSL